VTSATDRYKMLLASALERVCVLEAELEQAGEQIAERDARIVELELELDQNTDQEAT
jgi:hypothetical protein